MKKTLLNLGLLIWTAVFVLPIAAIAGSSSELTFHGYLMDSDSAKLPHKDTVLDFVQNYDNKTAQSTKSQAAGYMLFAGNWYRLDKHGNELAIEVLKHSRKQNGFYVTVDGKL